MPKKSASARRDLPPNRSIPSATIIPVVAYPDARAAVDWLCRTFGFVERLRIVDHRAQLTFEGGAIVVTDGAAASPGNSHHSIMVRVLDVDQHHEHAKQSGVRILTPPTDFPYGERQYSAVDLGGHGWTFSQTIADSDPKTWGGQLFE